VEAFPVEVDGRRIICLRDPANLSPRVVGLAGPTLFLVSLMDGTRTLRDLQSAVAKRFSDVIPLPDLERLVEELDESLLLDSPHFREHLARMERDYLEAPHRAATHAGSGYEADADALAARLDGWIGATAPREALDRVAGVIAPHIAFQRGGPTYAWAYRELSRSAAETVVVLGTSHVPLSRYFSVTRKDFATPFGTIPADTAFLDSLEERMGERLESDPLVHRGEHSVELQAVWLQRMGRPLRIVPILCGSLHEEIASGASPREQDEVARFLEALGATLREYGERAVVIAAADLAHVGTGFGDEKPPDAALLRSVEDGDRASLDAATRLDAEGFFRVSQEENDRRRVCGLAPVYAFLAALDADHGELLEYRQCVDPSGFRTVTIASAAFFRKR